MAECIVTNTWLCVSGEIDELIIAPKNLTFTFPNSENYGTQNPTHMLQASILKTNILNQIVLNFQASSTDILSTKNGDNKLNSKTNLSKKYSILTT